MPILWTGPKHSGKTSAAARLVERVRQEGFLVAGIVSPARYRDGCLVGFDVVDLATGERAVLAELGDSENPPGRFRFLPEGLRLGTAALNTTATEGADLIIVDEYGPLELADGGWRAVADGLLTAGDALVLLVVRTELAEQVARVYADVPCTELPAAAPDSVPEVLSVLRRRARGCKARESQISPNHCPPTP